MPHLLSAHRPEAPLTILTVERTGEPLATTLEITMDSRSRKKGLLGRDSLDSGHALVIAPCQGVHTFGMRFPIDVVAVTRDGTVVKTRANVRPNRIVLAWSAFAIIELRANASSAAGLRVGDRLRFK
jgi:uncharacterized membrane protein (UPF0127 family)